ncbi:transport and Golgi organization protein 1 [Drosophila innubila]|uniref:transport and Golgi organization protein 1 n=1 Tax=Drosophila innubila TaxID=198719 RepID=UPI00148DBD54|nr:transport and Golgi organization protein 1 [Drosophila innubila]
MISFKIHAPVRILSKSAGSNMKLWGVEINGRRGYANKDFIMEKKILISEKDLKYELPVQPLKPVAEAAPATAQIVNNPVQAEEKPSEDVQSPQEQQQPVLNASETAEDVATTTTSPLDTLKLSILTEQDQSGSSEVSTPITPVQANLQLVDGTELPLEALPATTERIENLTKVETAQEPRKAARTEATPETLTTTTSNDELDYEEDDDDDIYEDDDEDSTLDSKDNDIPNDKKAENVASRTEGEANVADKAPEVVVIPEPVTSSSSQATPAVVQVEEQTNSSLEAEAKHAAPVGNTSQIVPESQPTDIPNINEANLVKETQNVNAEPAPAVKVKLEQQPQAEEATSAIDIESKSVKQTIQKPLEVKQSDAELVKEEITAQPVVEEIVAQQIKEQTVSQSETIEAQKLTNETTVQELKIAIDTPKDFEPTEALSQQTTVPAAQLDIKVQKESATVETENVHHEIKAESMPTPVDTPKTETEPVKIVTNAAQPKEIIDEKVQEEFKISTAAQQTDDQSKIETEAALPVVIEDQQVEAEVEASKETQQTEVNQTEAPQIEAQPMLDQIETTTAPYIIQDSTIASPREETVAPPSLPPLFKKQNLNPNEYYKQLLEQQRQLAKEAAQQQQQAEDAAQKEAVVQEQQTTPTPSSYDAYEAVHQAEPTPAPVVTEERLATGTVEPIGLPALPADPVKEDAGPGLFTTIMDTVNSFISNQGQDQNEPERAPLKGNNELHRLLYPDRAVPKDGQPEGYCTRPMDGDCHATITLDNFVEVLASKVLDNSLLLLCVVIAAVSSLFFMFVYYCFCNSSQEGALLSKLNHLERSLLAAHKENLILKHDLMTTRTKLSSIEDNSFGSNDMVAALKKQLETELYEKAKLQEQVTSLEKDLDNAAEAGLELNKMLSEVLNGQNGDEAFMSTVEELQQQLNDQEKIIIEINASLAEKSRENSELQYSFTESTTRLTSEMKSLQQDNYELEMEKAKLQTRIEEIQAETEQELAKALEARNYEMQRLQHQIMESNAKLDKEHSELHTSLAKIESLEECLKMLKKDGNINVQQLIKSAKTRGELNAAQQKFLALQTKLEQELAAKTRLESQLKASSADVEQLKQDFNQSERDKLEAQTRLEVLSGYFREKETELQKELSLQEAKWLQHQGENASTVETQTLMKNEIQTLKSQNDELRAEIEAQIASHKAQMGTLENRAHESWLAARQSERRCEEAQAEAAGLRRKLTTMASGGAVGAAGDMTLDALPANGSMLAPELNSNPSPLPLPLPGTPGLLNMPNPLPFLPAPFSPFMGLPPPFLPPASAAGGARLPPLGRMRSPPPTSSSRGDRYDDRDDRDDYSDYDDYDDEEEDERLMDRRRRHSGSWGRGHRDDYMHSPRTYRSLSPSDSRYNYNDTETDFSPPPSPPPPRKSSRPINEV